MLAQWPFVTPDLNNHHCQSLRRSRRRRSRQRHSSPCAGPRCASPVREHRSPGNQELCHHSVTNSALPAPRVSHRGSGASVRAQACLVPPCPTLSPDLQAPLEGLLPPHRVWQLPGSTEGSVIAGPVLCLCWAGKDAMKALAGSMKTVGCGGDGMIKGRPAVRERSRREPRRLEAGPASSVTAAAASPAALSASSITLELSQNVQFEKVCICLFGP